MSFSEFVFEIPIYRLSFDEFHRKLDEEVVQISNSKASFIELFPKDYEKKYRQHLEKMREIIWYNWEYNEIIGYIGLIFFFNQITAELYYVNSKRIRKGVKNKIRWVGKVFEIHLDGDEDSNGVFNIIYNEIEKEKRDKRFRKRYIDTTKFYKAGKHINWINLIKENNQRRINTIL